MSVAVGNLIVYHGAQPNNQEIFADSADLHDRMRYNIVATVAHLALKVHDSPDGLDGLVRVAETIVRGARAERYPPPIIYPGTRRHYPQWIRFFLRRIRENFPVVYITDDIREADAVVIRRTWGTRAEEYNAKNAGFIKVHTFLVDNMINARGQGDQAAYDMLKFQLIISVAHELVHMLTNFLIGPAPGESVCMTPPNVELPNFGGEAGRYWEGDVLGGTIEFWTERGHPLERRQPGQAYIFADTRRDTEGARMSLRDIQDVVSGIMNFPLRRSSQRDNVPVTRSQMMQLGREETSGFRSVRRIGYATAATVPSGEASRNIVYRRPAEEPRSSYFWRR